MKRTNNREVRDYLFNAIAILGDENGRLHGRYITKRDQVEIAANIISAMTELGLVSGAADVFKRK